MRWILVFVLLAGCSSGNPGCGHATYAISDWEVCVNDQDAASDPRKFSIVVDVGLHKFFELVPEAPSDRIIKAFARWPMSVTLTADGSYTEGHDGLMIPYGGVAGMDKDAYIYLWILRDYYSTVDHELMHAIAFELYDDTSHDRSGWWNHSIDSNNPRDFDGTVESQVIKAGLEAAFGKMHAASMVEKMILKTISERQNTQGGLW